MREEQPPSDATVQMSPEEVARLHMELSAPNVASSQGGPGLSPGLIAGAVGCLLSAVGLALISLGLLDGGGAFALFDTTAVVLGFLGAAMLSAGFFAAARRTSPLATAAGVFAALAALIGLVGMLLVFELLRDFGAIRIYFQATFFAPGVVGLLAAIWALTELRPRAPALGIPAGLLGLIGAITGLAAAVMLLGGSFDDGDTDSTFVALKAVEGFGLLGSYLLIGAGFIVPIARAPRR